jgi:hypothetical protein
LATQVLPPPQSLPWRHATQLRDRLSQTPLLQGFFASQGVADLTQPATGLWLHLPALQLSVVQGSPSSQSAGLLQPLSALAVSPAAVSLPGLPSPMALSPASWSAACRSPVVKSLGAKSPT